MSAVLATDKLSRWYGQVIGLNDLTVSTGGGITGLVGPNGAGKSTFLKLIAGEIRPSRGELLVLGQVPFANRELYRRMGFCPQQDAFYEDMSAFEFVRLLLRLGGFSAREAGERSASALERLGLGSSLHRKVGGYSKGMRQRVKLAQAIAHSPELLVLDEPLSGLDPLGRHRVLELLREFGNRGTHVLISSHVLHEVENLTSDVLCLHRGRLLALGALEEIRALLSHHPRRVEIRAARPRPLAQALLSREEVLSVRLGSDDGLVSVETSDAGRFQRSLTEIAARERFGVQSLENVDSGLEAVFDYLVGG